VKCCTTTQKTDTLNYNTKEIKSKHTAAQQTKCKQFFVRFNFESKIKTETIF